MEINYDLIIKYLVKKEPVKEKKPLFSTQKGILDYSFNFPDKFKDLLADKFYRFGKESAMFMILLILLLFKINV